MCHVIGFIIKPHIPNVFLSNHWIAEKYLQNSQFPLEIDQSSCTLEWHGSVGLQFWFLIYFGDDAWWHTWCPPTACAYQQDNAKSALRRLWGSGITSCWQWWWCTAQWGNPSALKTNPVIIIITILLYHHHYWTMCVCISQLPCWTHLNQPSRHSCLTFIRLLPPPPHHCAYDDVHGNDNNSLTPPKKSCQEFFLHMLPVAINLENNGCGDAKIMAALETDGVLKTMDNAGQWSKQTTRFPGKVS